MKKLALLLPLSLLLAACGGVTTVNYDLEINFPDQDARDQAVSIRILTIIPDDTSRCSDLLSGDAVPGDGAYPIEDEISFAYPVDGKIEQLKGIGSGTRLFYAEAPDNSGAVILRGCANVESGRSGVQQVTIDLVWSETCRETNNGIETCDNVDNDCDEMTDEGDPADLCQTRDHAQTTGCAQGQCQYACEGEWQNANADWSDGCECQPTREGVEWCDGLDNDCDGMTDGASCTQCTSDSDCQATAYCITGSCDGGTCSVQAIENGQACDDNDPCTESDECDQGACVGQAKDCSDSVDCTADQCDETGTCQNPLNPGFCLITGQCIPEGQDSQDNACVFCNPSLTTLDWAPRDQGTSCEDGLWCTGTDICSGTGVCEHSELPCTQICNTGCDEVGQACLPDPQDTGCDDGLSCTTNDVCDGAGACGSIPDNTLCPGSAECRPACAQDETGCVYPPGQIVVDCPDSAPMDAPAECQITVVGAPDTAECVTCEAERLPMVLDRTHFYDASVGCTAGDWTVETNDCRLPAQGPNCPLIPAGSSGPCCTNLTCAGSQGLQFGQMGCENNGWRLSKELDLSNQARADLCYTGLRDNDWSQGAHLQGVVSEAGAAGMEDFFCAPSTMLSPWQPTRVCQALPSEAFSWGHILLTFWAEVFSGSSGSTIVDDLALTVYPTGCTQNSPIFRTLFSGCGFGWDNNFDGWSNSNGNLYCAQNSTYCGFPEGLLAGDHPDIPFGEARINMTRQMDLTGLRAPGKLCFSLYIEPDTDGDVSVTLQSSSGGETLLNLEFNNYDGENCLDYCLDLSQLSFQFFDSNFAQIRITAECNHNFVVVNDVLLLATLPCAAAGEILVDPVYDTGDAKMVPVYDDVGSPRRVKLNCRWGDSNVSASDEFDFVAP